MSATLATIEDYGLQYEYNSKKSLGDLVKHKINMFNNPTSENAELIKADQEKFRLLNTGIEYISSGKGIYQPSHDLDNLDAEAKTLKNNLIRLFNELKDLYSQDEDEEEVKEGDLEEELRRKMVEYQESLRKVEEQIPTRLSKLQRQQEIIKGLKPVPQVDLAVYHRVIFPNSAGDKKKVSQETPIKKKLSQEKPIKKKVPRKSAKPVLKIKFGKTSKTSKPGKTLKIRIKKSSPKQSGGRLSIDKKAYDALID